jgi:hypothetical protein
MNRVKKIIERLLRGGRVKGDERSRGDETPKNSFNDDKMAASDKTYNKIFDSDDVVVDDKSFEKLFVYAEKRRAKKSNIHT